MIAKIENGQFVKTVDIRKEFPNTSFPRVIQQEHLPEGYVIVSYGTPPELDENQVAVPSVVAEIDGVWQYTYTVADVQPSVPDSITMRQARLQLLSAGLLDTINQALATNPAAQIEWEYATEVFRNNPLIASVQEQLSMTDEQIDQLFIAASKL